MSTFSRLVSVVRQLVLAVGGSVARSFSGRGARAVRPRAVVGAGVLGSRSSSLVARCACRGRVVAVVLVGTSIALALGASVASAKIVHPFLFSFNGSGAPAPTGSFSPTGLAFDNSSSSSAGDLWVSDQTNKVVDKFAPSPATSTAAYQCQITGHGSTTGTAVSASECDTATFGTPTGAFSNLATTEDAVSQTSGDVFVPDWIGGAVDEFGPDGGYLSRIAVPGSGRPKAAALDTAGDVFIADSSNNRVDEFNAATGSVTTFATATPSGSLTGVDGVAVDDDPSSPSFGDVYVVDINHGVVDVFSPAGTWLRALTGTPSGSFGSHLQGGIAVDATSGAVYVADGVEVDHFDSSGAYVTTIPLGSGISATGLAIDAATGDLYVSESIQGVVDVFGPAVVVPDVTTEPVSGAAATSATLNGSVNPDGIQVTDCHFDYGTTSSYGQSTPCAQTPGQIGAGSSAVPVSANLSGLTPGTVYHFRLSAANANGANTGSDQLFGPPAIDSESSTGIGKQAATLQAQINPDGIDTSYRFEYGTTTSYGTSIPIPDANIGSGGSDVAVSQALSSLTPGTLYHWRVVATNASGQTSSADHWFTTVPVASFDAASVTNLSATSATLNAQINPLGDATTYHFEYGPTTSYGTSVPVPDAGIGSGTSDVSVSQTITGLSANTTYHWRIVATNATGTGYSPDRTFVYSTSGGGLPDGRAYEMVSPPYKQGGSVWFYAVSSDGDHVVVQSPGVFAGAQSDSLCNTTSGLLYALSRTSSGWTASPLGPPASPLGPTCPAPGAISADAQSALFVQPTPPHGEDDFYLGSADGTVTDVGPSTPPADGQTTFNGGAPPATLGMQVATSSDLSHLVYDIDPPNPATFQWPFAPSGYVGPYEYAGTGNSAPQLVSVTGGSDSTSTISSCQPFGLNLRTDYNQMSADGSTVFFTGGCRASGFAQVYARLNESQTVLLSARSLDCTGACQSSPASDANFEGASQDGSEAFFTSTQQLTNAASEDGTPGDTAFPPNLSVSGATGCANTTGANGCNLYEYDFSQPAGHELVAVSAGDTSGLGSRVRGVVRISEDGSHVYFVAQGLLSATANGLGQTAQAGADNLYVYERDASFPAGRTAFVAELCSGPGESGTVSDPSCAADLNSQAPNSGTARNDQVLWQAQDHRPAQATPDGRFLVFESTAQLTAGDHSSAEQVFRYDARTGSLERLSFGQQGYNDNGNTSTDGAQIVAPDFTAVARYPRTMSDDGSRVFFQSPDALTPRALNDVQVDSSGDLAQNVYEWEQAGVGSCPASHADGCVYLISDGRDANAGEANGSGVFGSGLETVLDIRLSTVLLLGTDASGDDVFFTTADQLVPQDTDTQVDIYDARVGGGFPAPAPASPCSGDACQGVPSSAPPAPVAASVTFTGPGNASPAAQAAGKLKMITKSVRGASFFIEVEVPGAGRIAITGSGVKTVRRTVSQAGARKLKVSLTGAARRTLQRQHKLVLRLRVAYAPPAGGATAATVRLTVKPPLRRPPEHPRSRRRAGARRPGGAR